MSVSAYFLSALWQTIFFVTLKLQYGGELRVFSSTRTLLNPSRDTFWWQSVFETGLDLKFFFLYFSSVVR